MNELQSFSTSITVYMTRSNNNLRFESELADWKFSSENYERNNVIGGRDWLSECGFVGCFWIENFFIDGRYYYIDRNCNKNLIINYLNSLSWLQVGTNKKNM